MQDNVIQTASGSEVYTHEILTLFDEYVHGLENPDEDIKKTGIFTGALKHVYLNLFKPTESKLYNAHTNLNLDDVDTLNDIWSVYTRLCYRFNHRPTILRFSILTGISMETFDNWRRRETRSNTSKHFESCKRWLSECENSLYDGASESNSIGSIFLLKSNFGYREAAPIPAELEAKPQIDTPEQIAARHASAALEMPEKPDLD